MGTFLGMLLLAGFIAIWVWAAIQWYSICPPVGFVMILLVFMALPIMGA